MLALSPARCPKNIFLFVPSESTSILPVKIILEPLNLNLLSPCIEVVLPFEVNILC